MRKKFDTSFVNKYIFPMEDAVNKALSLYTHEADAIFLGRNSLLLVSDWSFDKWTNKNF